MKLLSTMAVIVLFCCVSAMSSDSLAGCGGDQSGQSAQAGHDCGKCAGGGKGGCAKCKGAGSPGGCCGMGQQGKGGKGAGRGMGDGAALGSDHDGIHALLAHHDAIERHVEEVEGGVLTVTTSDDPEVVKLIQTHVQQMKRRVESGHGMRWWDPTFAELFRHHKAIVMEIEDLPNGVRVRESSSDPRVALLIRQHAIRGVSEFVSEGPERAHRPTPLPEGYAPAAGD